MMKDERDLGDVLSGLYRSEINFLISSFWDNGIEARIGDEMNGFRAVQTFHPARLGEMSPVWMADWLHAAAIKHFPDSEYAKRNT